MNFTKDIQQMIKDLNSYTLSKAFFNWSFEHANLVKPKHVALYFFAVEHCNRLGWKPLFNLPTSMGMDAIGIRDASTFKRALEDLNAWGILEVVEWSRNQYSSNVISLECILDKSAGGFFPEAHRNHTAKHIETIPRYTSTIYKLINYINSKTHKGAGEQIIRDIVKDLKNKEQTAAPEVQAEKTQEQIFPASTYKNPGLSKTQILTGAAHKAPKDLDPSFFKWLCDRFAQTTEIQQMHVNGFLTNLMLQERLQEFKDQVTSYASYKDLTKERSHRWINFTADWDQDDWTKRLESISPKENNTNDKYKQYDD